MVLVPWPARNFRCNPGPGFKASTSRVLSLSGQRSSRLGGESARGPCGGRSNVRAGPRGERASCGRTSRALGRRRHLKIDLLAMINRQKAHLGRHRRALTEGRGNFEANMMARARGGYLLRW